MASGAPAVTVSRHGSISIGPSDVARFTAASARVRSEPAETKIAPSPLILKTLLPVVHAHPDDFAIAERALAKLRGAAGSGGEGASYDSPSRFPVPVATAAPVPPTPQQQQPVVRANRHGSITIHTPTAAAVGSGRTPLPLPPPPASGNALSTGELAARYTLARATAVPVDRARRGGEHLAAKPSVKVNRRGSISIDFRPHTTAADADADADAAGMAPHPPPELPPRAAAAEHMEAHARIVQYALDLEQHVATTDAHIADANERARILEVELTGATAEAERSEAEIETLRAAARDAEQRLFELDEAATHASHVAETSASEAERVRSDAAQLSAALVQLERECTRFGEEDAEHRAALREAQHAAAVAARAAEGDLVATEAVLHSALSKAGATLVAVETTGGKLEDVDVARAAPSAPGANGATRFSLPCRYRVVHTGAGALVRRDASLYSDVVQTLPIDAIVTITSRRIVAGGVVRLGLEKGGWVSEFETVENAARAGDSSSSRGGEGGDFGASPPPRIVTPILPDLVRNAREMWEETLALMRSKHQQLEIAHAEATEQQRRETTSRLISEREADLASQRAMLLAQAEAHTRRCVEEARSDSAIELQRMRSALEAEHVAEREAALGKQRDYLGQIAAEQVDGAVADACEAQRNKLAMQHRVELDGALAEQRSALSQQFVVRHTHETRLALQDQQRSFEQQARHQMQHALESQRAELEASMARDAADNLAQKLHAQSELLAARAEEDKSTALTRQRDELRQQYELDERNTFEREKASLLSDHARDLEDVRRQHSEQHNNTRVMQQQRMELTHGLSSLKQNLDSLSLSVTAPAVNAPSADPAHNVLADAPHAPLHAPRAEYDPRARMRRAARRVGAVSALASHRGGTSGSGGGAAPSTYRYNVTAAESRAALRPSPPPSLPLTPVAGGSAGSSRHPGYSGTASEHSAAPYGEHVPLSDYKPGYNYAAAAAASSSALEREGGSAAAISYSTPTSRLPLEYSAAPPAASGGYEYGGRGGGGGGGQRTPLLSLDAGRRGMRTPLPPRPTTADGGHDDLPEQ